MQRLGGHCHCSLLHLVFATFLIFEFMAFGYGHYYYILYYKTQRIYKERNKSNVNNLIVRSIDSVGPGNDQCRSMGKRICERGKKKNE